MKTIHSLLVSAAIVLATPGLGVAAASTKDELTFAVSLDDKPIGVHRFRIADDGAMRVVDSEATFDVSILRVPVYRYRHSNTETWRNGCLKRIDSETDANGTPYTVDLSKTAAGYTIVTSSETRVHEVGCMMSFAYWDKRFLQQQRLLNTQTGEVIAVEIQSLGNPNGKSPTERYRLRGSAFWRSRRTSISRSFTTARTAAGLRSNRSSRTDGRCVMRWRRMIGWPRPSAFPTRLPPGDDRAGTEMPFLTLPIVFLWVACQTAPSTLIATVKHVNLERSMDD